MAKSTTPLTTKPSIAQPPPPLIVPKSITPKQPPQIPTFDSLPVDKAQLTKAIQALLAHLEKKAKEESKDLLGDEETKLYLVVGLKKSPTRAVHKPVRLAVPHPVLNPKQSPVTLFVKDPQRQYKDLLESSQINFIQRVVGLEKLRTKHKTFEAKRELLKESEMFLVDDRVLVEVGKSLGKMWREAKKQPIPISIARKDLKAELERSISSAYVQINTGTTLSIKFGSTPLHTPTQLLENLLSIIPQLAVSLPQISLQQNGFSAVQTLHIKSNTSTALPIYNCALTSEEGGRFSGESEEAKKGREDRLKEKLRVEEEKMERELEKEKRRIERSATKDGKGRAGKREVGLGEDAEGEKKQKKSKKAKVDA